MKRIGIFALFALLALPLAASAHESRTYLINGATYGFVVGSLGEPVVVDDKTGLDLSITRNGAAYEGAETLLKAEIKSGSAAKVFDLSTVYGQAGKYKTTFFITTADPLSYRISGELEGKQIDLLFDCSVAGHQMHAVEDKTRVEVAEGIARISQRGAFGCPAPKSDYEFPAVTSDQAGMVRAISSGKMLGGAGIVLALLALIVGTMALRSGKSGGGGGVSSRDMTRTIIMGILGVLVGTGGAYLFFGDMEKGAPAMDSMEMKGGAMDQSTMQHPMLEVDARLPVPSVSIEVMKDAKDGHNIHVMTKNFTFTPEAVNGENKPNTGHAHLMVNGVKLARLYGEWFNIPGSALKAGKNEIEVTLNANDHSEWARDGMHISAKVTVTK